MATAQETIAIWQALYDRGDEAKIPEGQKTAFDNAIRIGLLKDNRGFLSKVISPKREDLEELPYGTNDPQEALSFIREYGGDPTASISSDKYGTPTIATKNGQRYVNKPGFTISDIGRFVDSSDRFLKEVAPYVATASATGGLSTAAQIGAQGATGLAVEGLNQGKNALTGAPVDTSQLWKTPALAMAGDVGGRIVGKVATSLLNRFFGKPPSFPVVDDSGKLTKEAISQLERSGESPSSFTSSIAAALRVGGNLTKEQAERFNFLKDQGIDPLRAQVTRKSGDFQLQQEAGKASGPVRSALDQQDATLSGKFDTMARDAKGDSGQEIAANVVGRAAELDANIGAMYEDIVAALPNARSIQVPSFMEKVESNKYADRASRGVISLVKGYLGKAGLGSGEASSMGFALTGKGNPTITTTSPISAGEAEGLRIELNRIYKDANAEGRHVIRELKDALDQDVLQYAGKDHFEAARKMKADYEEALKPPAASNYDQNARSLVRGILENDIKADDVFNSVVLSKNWKPSDVQHLKDYLRTGDRSLAWDKLRGDTIRWLKDQTFKGPLNELEGQAASRAGLERGLDKIGRQRLATILEPQELKFLDDMLEVAKLREPVPGAHQGLGPSAQAIKTLEAGVLKYPILKDIWGAIKTYKDVKANLNPEAKTVENLSKPKLDAQIPFEGLRGLGDYSATKEDKKK